MATFLVNKDRTDSEKLQHIDLLLIGKSGHGKSSTGNTILGRPVFRASPSTTSVTQKVDFEVRAYKNYVIKVVDTPGVADTASITDPAEASKQVISQMKDAVILNPQGYHAFLLVLRYGLRYTQEEYDSVRMLKQIFGNNFVRRYCILILTCGDKFYTDCEGVKFKQWIQDQTGQFKDLVLECQGRVVLFDNVTKDENAREKQMIKLLKRLKKLNTNWMRYTDKNFRHAEINRQTLISDFEKQLISEDLNRISLMLQHLTSLSSSKERKKTKILNLLQSCIETLKQHLLKDSLLQQRQQQANEKIVKIQESIHSFTQKMNDLMSRYRENESKIKQESERLSGILDSFLTVRNSVREKEREKQNILQQETKCKELFSSETEKIKQYHDDQQSLQYGKTAADLADDVKNVDSTVKDCEKQESKISIETEINRNIVLKKLQKEFDEKLQTMEIQKLKCKDYIKEEKVKEMKAMESLKSEYLHDIALQKLFQERDELEKERIALESELKTSIDNDMRFYYDLKEYWNRVLIESSSCILL